MRFRILEKLYHTKDRQGATTVIYKKVFAKMIIPYQGLTGGYNAPCPMFRPSEIIPDQGLPGGYTTHEKTAKKS